MFNNNRIYRELLVITVMITPGAARLGLHQISNCVMEFLNITFSGNLSTKEFMNIQSLSICMYLVNNVCGTKGSPPMHC